MKDAKKQSVCDSVCIPLAPLAGRGWVRGRRNPMTRPYRPTVEVMPDR